MAKRLVVCCDGTWNLADQPSKTNVAKVALAVRRRSADGTEQRVYYHSGVGTNRRERLRGGAFGAGLSRNVLDAYRFLIHTYEPGDALYLFGFSRGAFTARSLAGLVRNCGILRPEQADRIDEVQPNPMGPWVPSRKGFYRLFRPLHRPIGQERDKQGSLVGNEHLADTVLRRREGDSRYRPPALEAYLKDVSHQDADPVPLAFNDLSAHTP